MAFFLSALFVSLNSLLMVGFLCFPIRLAWERG